MPPLTQHVTIFLIFHCRISNFFNSFFVFVCVYLRSYLVVLKGCSSSVLRTHSQLCSGDHVMLMIVPMSSTCKALYVSHPSDFVCFPFFVTKGNNKTFICACCLHFLEIGLERIGVYVLSTYQVFVGISPAINTRTEVMSSY